MTKEEIKQRNESKEFLKDLQYYLFQNKRSPKIDKLSVLLDNDEKRIEELKKENAELKEALEGYKKIAKWCDNCDKIAELKKKLKEELKTIADKDLSFVARFDALEKENAELKKDNEGYEKDNTLLVSQFNQTSAKLTKAKICLEQLVSEITVGELEVDQDEK